MDAEVRSFRVGAALASGMRRAELDRDHGAPFHGLRTTARIEYSLEWRARMLLPRLPDRGRFSHITAAVLLGIPLPSAAEADLRLHVAVPTGRRAPHARHLVGHANLTADGDATEVRGLPVSAPPRLLRELAAVLRLEDLVAAGDAMICGLQPLSTLDALADSVRHAQRFRGRSRALAALALIDRAESRPETMLRLALLAARLPEAVANVDVHDDAGRFIARPDLRFRGFPLVVEYEGGHHGAPEQWRRDIARMRALRAAGIDVVQATRDDLPRFEHVVADCRTRLVRLGWRAA